MNSRRLIRNSKMSRSKSSICKRDQLSKHLREALAFELLEPRNLLAGLPTLIDIFTGAGAANPSSFTNVNNTVFFSANNGTNGTELWKSDGTAGGTILVKDIQPGLLNSSLNYLTNVNGTSFFPGL